MKYLIAYAAVAVVFLVCDIIWLGWVARDFYRDQLGGMMADPIQIVPAVAFYLLYVFGVVVFVIAPALASGRITDALMYGALFGLVAYGTYDLTSLAVLKGFPAPMAYADMAWGAAVTAVSSAAGFWITQRFVA